METTSETKKDCSAQNVCTYVDYLTETFHILWPQTLWIGDFFAAQKGGSPDFLAWMSRSGSKIGERKNELHAEKRKEHISIHEKMELAAVREDGDRKKRRKESWLNLSQICECQSPLPGEFYVVQKRGSTDLAAPKDGKVFGRVKRETELLLSYYFPCSMSDGSIYFPTYLSLSVCLSVSLSRPTKNPRKQLHMIYVRQILSL